MIYTIDQSVESPIMLIDKHIGFNDEDGMGIDGSLFQKELMTLDGMDRKSIQCWMNTPGGNVFQGYMICNSILSSKTPVDTFNIGMVASMGFPVFMAGRKRVMMDYAIAMIHMPFKSDGSPGDKMTKAMGDSMVTMIASRSKISEDEVRQMMEAETWLNAEECLRYGFCTEIESTAQSNKKWMPVGQSVDMKSIWKKAKQVAASATNLLNTNTKNSAMLMTKVCMKLGLNEAATEDNIVESIKTIENRAYTAETKIIQIEDQHQAAIKSVTEKAAADVKAANDKLTAAESNLTKAQTDLTAKEKEYTDIKAKYDVMEKEKNDAVAAEKKTKAETMVNGFVKTGRIKNDGSDEAKKVIAKWVDLAVEDYDGTKSMIEAIPLNVQSQKIESVTDLGSDATKVQASAEFKMIEIANRNKQKASV